MGSDRCTKALANATSPSVHQNRSAAIGVEAPSSTDTSRSWTVVLSAPSHVAPAFDRKDADWWRTGAARAVTRPGSLVVGPAVRFGKSVGLRETVS